MALRVGELPAHHVAEHGAAGPRHLSQVLAPPRALVHVPQVLGLLHERRAYDWPCIIRCINTVDVMTAEGPELDWALLKRITVRITAEVPGICRICYDLTPKPVGTVEWE